jgi:predicted 2-oxoglutarate/Fe(II)-dependent dioxygenase YbiX
MTKPTPGSPFDLLLVASFLDPETCREFITEMRRSPAAPAVTYGQGAAGSVNESVRKAERIMPSRETVEYVTRRLMEYRDQVGEHFGVSLSGCEEPQFLATVWETSLSPIRTAIPDWCCSTLIGRAGSLSAYF